MPTLPCKHQKHVVSQVQPTIRLLTGLDAVHPDILRQHGIQPIDYHGSLVFRSAIESIRGSYIASSVTDREAMVGDVLENLAQIKAIHEYQHTGNESRYDFEVGLQTDLYAAIEVKGGEGNSVNISIRPLWAKEFGVWCHLSGAIVNQPAKGAHSIINRITNALVRERKHVDVVFFKDVLCGTQAKPCPKYPGSEATIGLKAAPDVFLFPSSVPVYSPDDPITHNPSPPLHTLDSLRLPSLILDIFGVSESERENHIWRVHVSVEPAAKNRLKRIVEITHLGEVVDRSTSRAWDPAARR